MVINILALIGITIFILVAMMVVLVGTVLYFKKDYEDDKYEENSKIL